MKILENIINKQVHIHPSLNNKRVCFLDIETTGLNKSIDTIYLIGIAFFDDNICSWKIKQFFAEELKEEIDILLEAYEIISRFDLIVNYNGTSFDIPFINSKLNYYKTNLTVSTDLSLDLYRIIRSNKNILTLNNYKLKTIEEYLGIFREDKHSGKECTNFYFDYLVTKNMVAKNNILLHNFDDLYYLLDVMDILNIFDTKKTFTIKDKGDFYIDNIRLNKDYLFINGTIDKNNIGNVVYFTNNYNIIINKDNTFEVSLEIMEGMVTSTEKCIFIKSKAYSLSKESYFNEYNIPRDLVILRVEKTYCIENLKLVLIELIKRVI